MAQQTAVEWFWIHLPENISKEYFDLFQQSKQIEKKQISDAYDWGLIDGAKDEEEGFYNGEDFYNGYYIES